VGRRYLALPLGILLAVLALLAALTAAGGIPVSIATPLISAVVAAVLTGGLGLLGIWMSIRYQIEHDRLDRLRDGYAKLLRAGVHIGEAITEVIEYPQGRPYPAVPIQAVSTVSAREEDARERARYDPMHVETAIVNRAFDLFAEAESAIFLEEGPDSPVLEAWATVADAYNKFRVIASEVGLADDAAVLSRRQELLAALDKLRLAAHVDLRKLATGAGRA
jgi:hypothetical protein